MSDNIQLARQARSQLAPALNALQLDEVPAHIQELAGTVAQVMSLLHHIETKGAEPNAANEALTHLRRALNQLQAPENAHPAAEVALEAVASSLGLVHQLTASFPKPAMAPQRQPAILAPTPVDPKPTAPTPVPPQPAGGRERDNDTPLAIAATQIAAATRAAEPRPAVSAPAQLETESRQTEPSAVAAPEPLARPAPEEEPIPLSRVSSPPLVPSTPPTSPTDRTSDAPKRISNNPVSLPALPAQHGELFIEAALGAYSTTNFFKGLSGNDIIDAGGLFVATYAPPDMGQQVRVQVALPGGFEFQARGVVTWVREMPKSGSLNPMSPPGFGVKFTDISKEARQLVYRYVRNREPLFYDDL